MGLIKKILRPYLKNFGALLKKKIRSYYLGALSDCLSRLTLEPALRIVMVGRRGTRVKMGGEHNKFGLQNANNTRRKEEERLEMEKKKDGGGKTPPPVSRDKKRTSVKPRRGKSEDLLLF